MKRIYFTIACGIALALFDSVQAQTQTFNYTGGVQTYTVPPCVTSITVDVQGAQGGAGPLGCSGYQGLPGLGGRVEATIPVTPGDVLTIYVGGAGAADNNTNAPGGFNGGGDAMSESAYTYYGGGGGGGASDIRLNGNTLGNRIVVAGGGGGAGSDGCTCNGLDGGHGGGLIANAGSPGTVCSCNPSGQGGTQGAGGVKGDWGCNCDAQAGSLGQGGNSNSTSCGGPTGGGGGGGGYYGGGGGGLGAGGGGSSYTDPSATGVTHTIGYRSGDGLVIITPNNGIQDPGAITGNVSLCENSTGTYSIASLPGATSYTWSVPTGTVINSGQGTTSINITAGSTSGTVSVTATYPCGTSNPSTFTLTINPLPTVTATAAAGTICDGSSDVLTASGASTYTWSSGGNAANETVSPSSTTTYTVTGTDANSCVNTATVDVTVNPLPTVTATAASGMICDGSSDVLTASGASTYTWSSGGNSATETVSPNTTTTYTVTGTDANSCVNTATVDVTVNPLPNVTAAASSTLVCDNDPAVTLTGSPAGGTWSGPGVSGNSFDPSVTGAGTYTLTYTYTDANSCTNTATVDIEVDVCTGIAGSLLSNSVSIYPNPNNGTFVLSVNANAGDMKVELLDMQGRIVFTSMEKNVQAGFNRTIAVNNLADGFYMLRLTTGTEQHTTKVSVQK